MVKIIIYFGKNTNKREKNKINTFIFSFEPKKQREPKRIYYHLAE